MPGPPASFRIAAVQASSAYLDRARSVEKACTRIEEAARGGAQLVVFPEAFIPGYPLWVWFIPPARTAELREAYVALHENAITIPGAEIEQIAAAARTAHVVVAISVNERNADASDTSLYSALVYVGADGYERTNGSGVRSCCD